MLADLLGFVLALVLLIASLWSSYLLALLLAREASPSVRWSATAVIACWLLAALFHLLTAISLFRLWAGLAAWIALAAVLHYLRGRAGAALLRADLERVRAVAAIAWQRPARWAALAAGIVLALRLARGLVAPPLAWDSLVYHLLKAGRWVQAGALTPEIAPDTWRAYEHYPPFGDALWAWAMLPVHGDALLAVAGALVLLACLLGVYATARQLGARELPAVLAALAVALTPAVANFLTSGYVNNTVLACIILSCVFVARTCATSDPADAVLAVAAMAVAAAAQVSALPLLLLVIAVCAVALLRGGRPLRWRVAGLALCLLVAAVALPSYVRAWRETGSPLFPFPLVVGGKTILEGDPQTSLLFAQTRPLPHLEFLSYLFFKRYWEGWEHLNLGPASLAVLLLGAVAGVRHLLRPGRRLLVVFLAASALVLVAGLMSQSMAGQRSLWAPVVGRFLTPVVGIAAALAASMAGALSRAVALVLGAAVLVSCTYAVPLGWSHGDLTALSSILLPLVLCVALAAEALSWVWGKGRPVLAVLAASAIVTVALGLTLPRSRAAHRYPIYAASAKPWAKATPWARSYDVHGIYRCYAAAWPIWRFLDDGAPHRIAASAGGQGAGHPWYRYPLLGSRLQNRVMYVPVTADGSVIDALSPQLLKRKADPEAWIGRLVDRRIDFFVALFPSPLEESWIGARKELFTRVATAEEPQFGSAYRFDRAAALRQRDGSPRR